MPLKQRTTRAISSTYIIFIILYVSFAATNHSWLLALSSGSTTEHSVTALGVIGGLPPRDNWTWPPGQGENSQLLISISTWSTAVVALSVLTVFTGAFSYLRRDPIVIDD